MTAQLSHRLAELRARSNNPRIWPRPGPGSSNERWRAAPVGWRLWRLPRPGLRGWPRTATPRRLVASPAGVGFDRSGTLCIVRVSRSVACLPLSAPVGHGGARRGLAHWKGYMDCTTENGVAALVRQRHHPATAGAFQTDPRAGIGIYQGLVRILTGSLDLAM